MTALLTAEELRGITEDARTFGGISLAAADALLAHIKELTRERDEALAVASTRRRHIEDLIEERSAAIDAEILWGDRAKSAEAQAKELTKALEEADAEVWNLWRFSPRLGYAPDHKNAAPITVQAALARHRSRTGREEENGI